MYREIEDSEILYMIEENPNYYNILLEKYKILGKRVGYEIEDLIQIGNLGLLEAIKFFKENKKVLFYTYINRCIENKIKVELRSQLTQKRKMLNCTISYDELIEGTDKTLIDFLEDKEAINPYEELLAHDLEEKYIIFIQSLPIEVAVAFEMKNDGFTTKQIGEFLEMDSKTVHRSIQFARQKIVTI